MWSQCRKNIEKIQLERNPESITTKNNYIYQPQIQRLFLNMQISTQEEPNKEGGEEQAGEHLAELGGGNSSPHVLIDQQHAYHNWIVYDIGGIHKSRGVGVAQWQLGLA